MAGQSKIQFRNFPIIVDEDLPASVNENYEKLQHDMVSNQFEDVAIVFNEFVESSPKAEHVRIKIDDAQHLTKMVKDYATYLGAVLVGITRLDQDKHLPYSGTDINHKYAVAIAFEENYEILKTAPSYQAMRDYWRTYSLAATGAVHLATFIRELGFEALAHHVRSHLKIGRAICMVPIAIDAGLGELGRNGVLITKKYGPRVRIGIVTTSAPLITDKPVDIGVDKFCSICNKCLRHCPTKAISEEKKEVRGAVKWKVDGDKCINACARTYECTLCFKVCPWNKPHSFSHSIGSTLAGRSGLARRFLNYIDDVFYGK